MSLTTEGMTPSDLSAIMGNNDGFGNGIWWLLILFLFAFGGFGGNGFGGRNDVLQSDFATIQRQLSDGTNTIERKLDNQNAGICDLGYTQAQLVNNLGTQMMQMQMQNQQCCCENRYDSLVNSNNVQNAVNTGFCNTNFNLQNGTRDVIDNQNANTRAILDALANQQTEALKARIAEQNQQISFLNLQASQATQNQYLINALRPSPVPAFSVNAPYQYGNCACS